MKKIAYLLSSIFLISCNNTSSQIIENIDALRFQLLIKKEDGIILDVRTPQEFHSGHIKDATNINFYEDDFSEKLTIIRKNIPIYVYCRSGGRSSKAAIAMKELGFAKIYNLIGGMGAWDSENYESVKSKKEEQEERSEAPYFTVSEIDNVLKKNEVVLVNFSTQWCVPCKKMKPVIKEIQKENINIKVLYIDADEHQELIKKYQIQGVPVFMVFKNGKEIFKHVGIISKQALLKQLN
ncbi:MAG: thioredoxin [Flavobacteriales bacterium]|nr:thioredoxin [Flavobacteriales bacterium]